MPSQELGSSLGKKLGSCCTLESAISTLLRVLRASHKSDMCATRGNWNASSSQMETSITLEGFKRAEQVHGVRCIHFIGSGNSFVYPTFLQNVPVWGHIIQKLECANHACKCYRTALEKLAQENPNYKGRGGLTQKMCQKLTSAAWCAIKMCSMESDTAKAVKSLEKDLINGPFHCFGHHNQCSPDFCLTAEEMLHQFTSAERSLDISAKGSTETSGEGGTETSGEGSTETSGEGSMETSGEGSIDISREVSMDISREESAEAVSEGEECKRTYQEADSSDDISVFGKLGHTASIVWDKIMHADKHMYMYTATNVPTAGDWGICADMCIQASICVHVCVCLCMCEQYYIHFLTQRMPEFKRKYGREH